MNKDRYIAVVRGVDKENIVDLAKAFYEGGIRCMELPLSQKAPETQKETFEMVEMLVKEVGDKMAIGVGTVCSKDQIKKAKKAGATILVSPHLDLKVLKYGHRKGFVCIPGAYSPTEVQTAAANGADFVKIFPGHCVSEKYISEISNILPKAKLMLFGGFTKENCKSWMKHGAFGAGLQSAILDKQAIANKDFAKITALCKEFTDQNE